MVVTGIYNLFSAKLALMTIHATVLITMVSSNYMNHVYSISRAIPQCLTLKLVPDLPIIKEVHSFLMLS